MHWERRNQEDNRRREIRNELFEQRQRNADGRDDAGYDENGYDVDGYDRYGFDRRGLSKTGRRISDYVAGFDYNGLDPWGRAKEIEPSERVMQLMANEEISGENIDDDGFDEEGYDAAGYDREGFNRENMSRTGHHRWDYADGYDEFDRDAWGRHRFSDDHFFN